MVWKRGQRVHETQIHGVDPWPYIRNIFTVREEDSEALIMGCLPVCHKWYSSHDEGECCWLPLYRTLSETLNKKRFLQDAPSAVTSLGSVAALPAGRMNLWSLVVLAFANGGFPIMMRDGGAFKAVIYARKLRFVNTETDSDRPSCRSYRATTASANRTDVAPE